MKWLVKRFRWAALGVSLLAALFIPLEYQYFTGKLESDVQSRVILQRDDMAQIIKAKLEKSAQIVRDAASFVTIETDTEKIKAYFMRLLADNSSFIDLYLGKPDNTLIDASGWVMPEDFKITLRPSYLKARAHGVLIYTDAYRDASTDKMIMSIAIQAFGPDGKFAGVVAGDILLTDVINLFTDQDMAAGKYCFMVDGRERSSHTPGISQKAE